MWIQMDDGFYCQLSHSEPDISSQKPRFCCCRRRFIANGRTWRKKWDCCCSRGVGCKPNLWKLTRIWTLSLIQPIYIFTGFLQHFQEFFLLFSQFSSSVASFIPFFEYISATFLTYIYFFIKFFKWCLFSLHTLHFLRPSLHSVSISLFSLISRQDQNKFKTTLGVSRPIVLTLQSAVSSYGSSSILFTQAFDLFHSSFIL